MIQQGARTVGDGTTTQDIHVFHYVTYSAVTVITINTGHECNDSRVPHEHTRDGHHLYRCTNLFTTPEAALAFATDTTYADAYDGQTITVHPTTRDPRRFAVKIDAGHNSVGTPRRGWMIYTPTGEYLGFVDEEYAQRAALASVGSVVELCTIDTYPSTHRDLLREPYPRQA